MSRHAQLVRLERRMLELRKGIGELKARMGEMGK